MTDARPLPDGWRWATLGEVCQVNPRRPRAFDAQPDDLITFIPMAAVDEATATVAQPLERPLSEVTKGYTYMQDGDVIFAKITPCMQNGKHAIVGETRTGFAFGSTEFHVLRPGADVHPVWVHQFLLQPSLLREAERNFTGTAGQRRVPKDFLINKAIPLPPIEEQRRIVADLEQQMSAADRARRAAQAQLDAALAMPAALLREVFPRIASGAPKERRWRSVKLGDVCNLIRGITFAKSDASPSAQPGHVPLLRAGNIGHELDTENDLVWVPRHYVDDEKLMCVNDIAVCMSSGSPLVVGKSARLTSEWYGSVGAFCAIIRADEPWLAKFVSLWFKSDDFLKWRDGQATGVNIQNLRMSELASVELAVPPLDEQHRIVARLERQNAAADRARRAAEAELAAAEALPAAILRRAFREAA